MSQNGLARYVHGRNSQGPPHARDGNASNTGSKRQGDEAFDDLKVDVPVTPSKNNSKGKKSQGLSRRPSTRSQDSLNPQGNGQPLDGTNASCSSRSPTETGLVERPQTPTGSQRRHSRSQGHSQRLPHVNNDFPDDDDVLNNPMLQAEMAKVEAGQDQRGASILQRRLSGDSYPQTTTGPDEADNYQGQEQPTAQANSGPAALQNLPQRGSGTRVSSNGPTFQAGHQEARVPHPTAPPGHPHFTNPAEPLTSIQSGFAFAKANPSGSRGIAADTRPTTARPPPPQQRQSLGPSYDNLATTNGEQQGMLYGLRASMQPPREEVSRGEVRKPRTPEPSQLQDQRRDHMTGNNAQEEHAFSSSKLPKRQRNDIPSDFEPEELNLDDQSSQVGLNEGAHFGETQDPRYSFARQQYEHHTYDQRNYQGQQHEKQPQFQDGKLQRLEQAQTEQPQPEGAPQGNHLIDYEVTDLYNMSFEDLKSQSFDKDPNAKPFAFDERQQSATLQQNLDTVLKLPNSDKKDFLATLTLEEWEEAGDWFLERFGEIIGKFKVGRQDKRKLASQFESRVEKRHEYVSKKRKLTEIALGEMRESGGKVLQGTPKKSRKTK